MGENNTAASQGASPAGSAVSRHDSARRPLFFGHLRWPLLFVSLWLLLLASWLIHHEFRDQRRQAEDRLVAVSELRQSQVDAWLDDLRGQARFLSGSAYWSDLLLRGQRGDQASLELLFERIVEWRKTHGSDSALLLGAGGEVLAREHPASRAVAPQLQAAARQALAEGLPVLTAIYRRDGTEIPLRLDVVIPLLRTGKPAQAAVVLRIDARRWLFPTLRAWPVPTESGETALWRREGDQLVVMNELREQIDAAGQLRLPLQTANWLPARLERAEQREGVLFEGWDYRDAATLAVGRRIKGTDWWLIAEQDIAEIEQPAYRNACWIAWGTLALLLALAAAARVWAQRQSLRELEQLRVREQQARELIEATPDAMLVLDASGRVTQVNRRFEALLGYPEVEVVGHTAERLVPAEACAGHPLLGTLRGSPTVAAAADPDPAMSLVCRDGRVFPAEIAISAVKLGQQSLFVVSIRDVTTRKQAEAELQAYRVNLEQLVALRTQALADAIERMRVNEERLDFALSATQDGIWDWNFQTGASFVNAAYSTMLGYAPGELASTLQGQFTDLLHPDERERCFATERQLLQDPGSFEVECRLRCRDGRYKWVLRRGKLVERDPRGEPVRAVGTHLDLSARKQIEAQLRAAKEAAESADRAKSDFLSNISHELRTPMNAIMGMAFMLQNTGLDANQREQLRQLQAASQQLLALIDDILCYIRIDTGTLSVGRQSFELDRVLDTALGRVRDKAVAKGLKLKLDVPPELPPCLEGDGVQIGQVLHKLADNAVKFTDAGEVALAVGIESRPQQRALLRFEVSDSGIGLSAEEQACLFQTFRQVDNSSTRKQGGTGLGLAIAKRLVELMGGSIGVESEPGHGSRFWFSVPVGITQLDPGHEAAAPAPPDPAQPGTDPPVPDRCPDQSPAAPRDERPLAQPAADLLAWPPLRARLLALLREDCTDSVQLFEQQAALIGAALGERFEPMAAALRNFDFEAALALLEAAG